MDILDILLDILLKPPQPFIGLFSNLCFFCSCSARFLSFISLSLLSFSINLSANSLSCCSLIFLFSSSSPFRDPFSFLFLSKSFSFCLSSSNLCSLQILAFLYLLILSSISFFFLSESSFSFCKAFNSSSATLCFSCNP